MAITQVVSAIPAAGQRGVQARDVFVAAQEAFQDKLTGFTVTELNAFATQANTLETNVNNKEVSVVANALTATTKATLATDYAEKVNATVETGTYSSKEHAIGDLTESGGSAKAWAIDTASPDGTTTKSAKTLAGEAAVSATTATTQAGIATTQANLAGGYANAAIVASFAGSLNYPTFRPSLNLDFANSRTVDPRITFTRASAGTIYNKEGLIESVASGVPRITFNPVTLACEGLLIEEARTNLLTHSNQFHNSAWTKGGITIAANVISSPDGTTTADRLTCDGGGDGLYQNATVTSSTVYTFSGFVNFGTLSQSNFQLAFYDNTNLAFIALDVVPTFMDIGNGWYRYYASVATPATCTSLRVYPFRTTLNFTSSTFYLWGAQLEAGAFPTSYIPSTETFTSRASTATYYNSAGLLASAPVDTVRMTYNPTNLKLAPTMLLEDAGTNSCLYSEDFTQTGWVKTVTLGTPVSYAGINMTLMTDNSTTVAQYVYRDITVSNDSNTNAISLFVKMSGTDNLLRVTTQLMNGTTPLAIAYDVDLSTGSASVASGSGGQLLSIDKLVDGVFRLKFNITNNSTGNNVVRVVIYPSVRTGITDIGSVYVGGVQVELNTNYPTSYIPTTTAAVTRAADVYSSATATRAADVAYMDGTNFSEWYRQDEGSFVLNYKKEHTATKYPMVISKDVTTTSPKIMISSQLNTNILNVNNSLLFDVSMLATGINGIYAFAYKNNDYVLAGNGGVPVTDTSVQVPTINILAIGSQHTGVNQLGGTIKSLTYYPKRLTNTELQLLSTN